MHGYKYNIGIFLIDNNITSHNLDNEGSCYTCRAARLQLNLDVEFISAHHPLAPSLTSLELFFGNVETVPNLYAFETNVLPADRTSIPSSLR